MISSFWVLWASLLRHGFSSELSMLILSSFWKACHCLDALSMAFCSSKSYCQVFPPLYFDIIFPVLPLSFPWNRRWHEAELTFDTDLLAPEIRQNKTLTKHFISSGFFFFLELKCSGYLFSCIFWGFGAYRNTVLLLPQMVCFHHRPSM